MEQQAINFNEAQLPTMDEIYSFLRTEYKAERFDLRDGKEWGESYSRNLANSYMDDLREDGWSLISHHDTACGKAVKFDRSLRVMERS